MTTKEKKFMVDKEKPMFDKVERKAVMVKDVEPYDCLDALADILVEEGVTENWTLEGSGLLRLSNPMLKRQINRIFCTHELECGYAAEAYGRIARRPGVVTIGPGTGVTNLTSPIHQARSAQAPMVFIIADSSEMYDGRWAQQGGLIPSEFVSPLLKRPLRRLTLPTTVAYQTKLAFRDAVSPISGPMGVAVSEDLTCYANTPPATTRSDLYNGYVPGNFAAQSRTDMFKTQVDPKSVEEALKWLLEADRPAMVCGESIWYHDAVDELNEFVHMLGIPCHTRRLARGAISEYDPLNCFGRARGKVMRASDRAMVLGLGVRYLENYGRPPFWGVDTRYIQIQSSPEMQCLQLPTEFEMNGSMKYILRQMIDCLKDMGIKKPVEKWEKWRQTVTETRNESLKKPIERVAKLPGKYPFHPDLTGKLIGEWLTMELEDDFITILGGFTATSFYTDWIRLRTAGRVLDATDTIGIGHPIPMAIGASLADGRKHPVIALMGDGDFYGGCGMAYETAVKWEVPVIGVHMNNNAIVTNTLEVFSANFAPTRDFYKDFSQIYPPKIRTDKMIAEFGIHTEYVERDNEMVPALNRCLAAVREGVPAYINVITDPVVSNEIMAFFTSACYGNIPYNDLVRTAKRYLLEEGFFNKAYARVTHDSWLKALEIYEQTGEIPESV